MEIDLTTRNLMQKLIDETTKLIVSMINHEFQNFPPNTQQEWATTLHPGQYNPQMEFNQIDANCDLQKLLKLLLKDWDTLKDKFFVINGINGYGHVYRSYLYIMQHGRNELAHQNTQTFEDVLSYAFNFQRFFRCSLLGLDISEIDLIIEICLGEISKSSLKTGVEPEPPTIEELDILDLSKIIELRTLIDKNEYKGLSSLVDYKYETMVNEGRYPGTLYIKGGDLCFITMGYTKLKLIKEKLFEVSIFAIYGIIPPDMKGIYDGIDLICIPSSSYARVSIARAKARLLCASIDKIVEWIENNT